MDESKGKELYKGLDEYIRQGEPQEQERGRAWQTAIGLQDVDGLKTSPYLLETEMSDAASSKFQSLW